MQQICTRHTRCRIKPQWFSPEVKEAVKRKKAAWDSHVGGNGTVESHDHYKIARNQASKVIRKSILDIESKLVKESKKNPKLLNSYINKRQNVRDQIRMLRDEDGSVITDKQSIAQRLNNQFSSVFIEDIDTSHQSINQLGTSLCEDVDSHLLSPIIIEKMLNHYRLAKFWKE